MTELQNERLLKIGQAARLLGLTPATLRNWERRGLLLPVRLPGSRQRMYRLDELVGLVEKAKE